MFRLDDLGGGAEHTTGWIVQPYLELVTIRISALQLLLFAAGTD